ncbi:MAG: hypothetical protein CM1200mP30_10840 [Pseudomonadota bacterium]|nr:MAG: hypothetical protein CM1200mP30_10840 [Pseudomonadota bacterium]
MGHSDIRDLGDVPLPEANNNEKCIEHITDFYTRIAETKNSTTLSRWRPFDYWRYTSSDCVSKFKFDWRGEGGFITFRCSYGHISPA